MSDFFRQLVVRHRGNAEPVQPWIPTRFAAEPEGTFSAEPPWSDVVSAPTAPRSVPAQNPAQPNPSPSAAVAPRPAASPPIQPTLSVQPKANPADSPTRLETMTQWIHQVEHESTVVHFSESRAIPVSETMPPPLNAPPIMPPAIQAGGRGEPSVSLPVPTVEPAPTSPIGSVALPERSPAAPIPPPSQLSPLNAIAPIQSIQPPLPSVQPPTIRVSIGRVEIRAVSPGSAPSPMPRRAAPVQRPALSLDAYLHQRSRRS